MGFRGENGWFGITENRNGPSEDWGIAEDPCGKQIRNGTDGSSVIAVFIVVGEVFRKSSHPLGWVMGFINYLPWIPSLVSEGGGGEIVSDEPHYGCTDHNDDKDAYQDECAHLYSENILVEEPDGGIL